VRTGSRLSQLRFRAGAVRLEDQELRALHLSERLVTSSEPSIESSGVAVSVALAGFNGDGLIGYAAKRHTGVVDVDRVGACKAADFWDPLYVSARRELILDPDLFYILASKEAVHVPPDYAAEMTPFDPLVGEFRVHYAGFFDPGFGHAGAGGAGSRAVLEVRSRDVPFILEDGQIVGRLVYERMAARPAALYGADLKSNYQAQGLKLSKHFVL
jgi:dCTP deaminase